jgi:glucokinase-like ROK family protein
LVDLNKLVLKENRKNSISKHLLSKHNKTCILHTVWENKGISRLEISRQTKLSTATVSRLVNTLIRHDRLLEERETIPVSKGRPMKSLYFGNNERFIIGIDLGTTYIRGMLTDMSAEPIKEIEVVTESLKGWDYVLSKVVDVIERLADTNLVRKEQIIGVGMAVAGIINLKEGVVVYSPAFQWRNVKLHEYIQSRIKLPLFIDNVSRVMALGELAFGHGNDFDNLICVNVGYGIGAGIIINKKIFYGTEGIAGEFGHIPVNGDNLVLCPCGKNTCLTAYSSGDAIAQRARLKMKNNSSKILMDLCNNLPERITAKTVAEAALLNDKISLEIFSESVHILGLAIAGLINIFNPQAVFIGGGVAQNGDIFWEPLKKTIQNKVFDQLSTKYEILPVSFHDRAALYGAIGLVINEILNMDI